MLWPALRFIACSAAFSAKPPYTMSFSPLPLRFFRLAAALTLVLMGGAALQARAQVVVAPKVINLSDEERFASVFVENRTNRAQEVNLAFRFGYPVTDSLGNVSIHYGDEEAADTLSIDPFVQSYPQQFLLPPGQRQRVRLALRPPENLPPGMYWARLAFTASQYQEKTAPATRASVETRIHYRFRQVISVFYRHGSLETGLRFQKFRSSRDSSSIYITAHVERTGNAPFLGTATLQVVNDSTGTSVATQEDLASVYFDMTHRFALSRPDLPPGMYRARLTYETRREDVSSSDLIPAQPVSRTLMFAVQ